MKKILFIAICAIFLGCNGNAQKNSKADKQEKYPVTKTDAEWKKELTPAQYAVLRQAATETAFTSPLLDVHQPGTFVCAACGNPVYKEKYKFDSGTGWPSFDRPIEGGVAYGRDSKLGFERKEVHCARCGGHLGHVFNDGPPETTGKRHCINGVALNFIPDEK